MPELSLVIMTFNEASNIERCLDSAALVADEILVVDSYSKDNTVELAKAKGARVIMHPFLGFKEQRIYAISQAKYNCVLILDADEALDEKLRHSILSIKESWPSDCYTMNRMSNIDEQWIHHGGWYPDKKMRLFDRRHYQIGGLNPHDKIIPKPEAKHQQLKGNILHYTNSNIEDRIATINKFSTVAAQAFFDKGKRGNLLRILFKPGLRFFVEYFIKRGFLNGFYGFAIAKTSAQYVFYRELKLHVLSKKERP